VTSIDYVAKGEQGEAAGDGAEAAIEA